MDDPAISVRNLVVSYDNRRVLDGINLDVARGETMVLLGGSGSGKSTLLRQIIGLARPESGQVIVNGVDLSTTNQKELKKLHRSMGVAFQNAALFDSLSLEENVALPLRELTRLDESTIRLMTWMKLSVVGLADFRKLTPRALSGGMKKRAAVARASRQLSEGTTTTFAKPSQTCASRPRISRNWSDGLKDRPWSLVRILQPKDRKVPEPNSSQHSAASAH